MNRVSLVFATLLAATFMVPGRVPETTSVAKEGARAEHAPNNKPLENSVPTEADLDQRAQGFLDAFVNRGSTFGEPISMGVIFATVADPVETHLSATFDHDVAALQDAVQDSGYLFDSSWIVWETPRTYDSIDDDIKAENLRQLKHHYPGILLFRSGNNTALSNPYGGGLIVFLLAEKPTAGISIDQANKAMQVITTDAVKHPFLFPSDTAMIAGPGFSGSLHSLIPLMNAIRTAGGQAVGNSLLLKHVLIRSAGFTSCETALVVAQSISQRFKLDVDMGSAQHPLQSWTEAALQRLQDSGIQRTSVAVISEGESLFGESAEETTSGPALAGNASDTEQNESAPRCKVRYTGQSEVEPFHLEFPRDISALRSSYEKQGLFDNPSNPETGKRSLRLSAEEASNGDSIRTFGAENTVVAEESVLFGMSEFIRSHGIHAVIIAATSEQDSYFLTRFFHANNAGVRVVVLGATRLFTRGDTSQFHGDMMVSSFPLLPRLFDWTALEDNRAPNQPLPQDPTLVGAQGKQPSFPQQNEPAHRKLRQDLTEHVFPNDSSAGEYIAARDLLWDMGTKIIPREYSRPTWSSEGEFQFKPPVYIAALGGGAAWPLSEFDTASGFEDSGPPPQKRTANSDDPKKWRLTMPFRFGDHLVQTNGISEKPSSNAEGAPQPRAQKLSINASGYWKMMFWICIAIPFTYCAGMIYADPIQRRTFAYLQAPVYWQHWILLVSIPALLSEVSLLPLVRQMTFPSGIGGNHEEWYSRALFASVAIPLLILLDGWLQGKSAGCFEPIPDSSYRRKSLIVLAGTLILVLVFFSAFFVLNDGHRRTLDQVLYAYREMHWESGLSLLPTIQFITLGLAVWNYEALIGIGVLHQRPRLPNFPHDDRISDKAAKRIAEAGRFLPSGHGARGFWVSYSCAIAAIAASILLWPSFLSITTLSAHWVTKCVLALACLAALFIIMDILQFAWLWTELHELLLVLNRQTFKRSFIPLRDFNWSTIWSFSGGSFKERRKVLAALVECAFELQAQGRDFVSSEYETTLKQLKEDYSRLDVTRALGTYRGELRSVNKIFADIGSTIAMEYEKEIGKLGALSCTTAGESRDNPFGDDQLELEQIPSWLRVWERFLCLLYLAFIRVTIARLRTLAISIVSVFSLVGLGIAVCPFQPVLPLFVTGAAALTAIGVVMFVVFSQMDRDAILARILQSDPNKLEWSFYGKFIDTLALPLLTLLSGLLPGGAGRLIDLIRAAFNHAQ